MIKTRRSTRGLSPIFAVLILIAIAVIAGIVVYMFTSGFIGSLTGNPSTGSEKVAIQAIQGTGQMITVYAMSQSGGPIALDSAIVKNAQGGTIEVITLDPAADIIESSLTTLPITTVNALTPGSSYSVQLVSVAGGNFPSQSFKAT